MYLFLPASEVFLWCTRIYVFIGKDALAVTSVLIPVYTILREKIEQLSLELTVGRNDQLSEVQPDSRESS
jgi:hypothetical protein